MKNYTNRFLIFSLMIQIILGWIVLVIAGDNIVTTTKDVGPGSLREAIIQANNNPGPDIIIFKLTKGDSAYNADTGVWTFRPMIELPFISDDGLILNGQSQVDFVGEDTNPFGPEIEIDGSDRLIDGLRIFADDIEIYNITINRCIVWGISMHGVNNGIIAGCYIGTGPAGMKAASNGYGILLGSQTSHVQIMPFEGNPCIISGNKNIGIAIDDTSTHNFIRDNIIGLNRTADDTIGNGNYGGIRIFDQSDSNEVVNNLIGGNTYGIFIYESSGNTIFNNLIGTDETFEKDFGNSYMGIDLRGEKHDAVGNVIIENIIGYNGGFGIQINYVKAVQNRISMNSIFKNSFGGIDLYDGGNKGMSSPKILSVTESQIKGTTQGGSTVEAFSDEGNQGKAFIGSTTADASGNFTVDIAGPLPYKNVTATATDDEGNTSVFSLAFTTGIDIDQEVSIPDAFILRQNYPNPFNPETVIPFEVKKPGHVLLHVYSLTGQEVTCLINEDYMPGRYNVRFSAAGLCSGIYFYCMQMGDFEAVKKMVVVE
jgi:parallel beta-helix repeat protein